MTTITTNLYPELFPALSVAEVDVVEGAAGPGRRLVIWLQGCWKRCPGCANGPFLPKKISRAFSVEQLLALLDDAEAVDGITLSGGEPILQAASLVPLLQETHKRGLTTVCYTGYALEELIESRGDAALAKFLSEIDLLIDGEYRQELPRSGVYRPSSNQRLHFLSDRISPESCVRNTETVFNVSARRVVATGTLPMAIRRALFEKLRARGITLGPAS